MHVVNALKSRFALDIFTGIKIHTFERAFCVLAGLSLGARIQHAFFALINVDAI
jgi:hypothetical protein